MYVIKAKKASGELSISLPDKARRNRWSKAQTVNHFCVAGWKETDK